MKTKTFFYFIICLAFLAFNCKNKSQDEFAKDGFKTNNSFENCTIYDSLASIMYDEYIVYANDSNLEYALFGINGDVYGANLEVYKFGIELDNAILGKEQKYCVYNRYNGELKIFSQLDHRRYIRQTFDIVGAAGFISLFSHYYQLSEGNYCYFLTAVLLDDSSNYHLQSFYYAKDKKLFFPLKNHDFVLGFENYASFLLAFDSLNKKIALGSFIKNAVIPIKNTAIIHLIDKDIVDSLAYNYNNGEEMNEYIFSKNINSLLDWVYKNEGISYKLIDKGYSISKQLKLETMECLYLGFREVYINGVKNAIELCIVNDLGTCINADEYIFFSFDKFIISGKDEIVSVFGYHNPKIGAENKIVVISKTQNQYFTNIYNYIGGGRCNGFEKEEYINHYNLFSQVKCYEDFINQYPLIMKRYDIKKPRY